MVYMCACDWLLRAEAMAGHCTQIDVTVEEDGSVAIQDNGRGIPCEVHEQTGKSSLETVFTVLHAGGKFGGESSGYTVSILTSADWSCRV